MILYILSGLWLWKLESLWNMSDNQTMTNTCPPRPPLHLHKECFPMATWEFVSYLAPREKHRGEPDQFAVTMEILHMTINIELMLPASFCVMSCNSPPICHTYLPLEWEGSNPLESILTSRISWKHDLSKLPSNFGHQIYHKIARYQQDLVCMFVS